MGDAKRDNNYVPTALVVDETGAVQNLEIDTSSGRLLIDVTLVATTTPTLPTDAVRDENNIPTIMGDDSGTATPLIIDNRNGYLFLDVLVE